MYGNPQPPQHGYPQPPPQTVIVQRRGGGCLRAFLIGATVLIGLVVIGALLSGGDKDGGNSASSDDTAATDTSAPAKKTEPKSAGIGDTVKDGKFAFKVAKVEKGVARVGDEYVGSDAQGQYVLVHVTVKNIGEESQLFSDSSQKLIDTKGRQYDPDSGAAALGLKNSNAFLNTINPGNAVNGILLFDVPKNFRIKAIELHDSIFSDGVTVALND
ncbi:DUF4352 domain-containing protein [Streptosporangium sp. NBC_01755]|uniref:DUF4352 domain-containing protein n=1 Tax=unclassified Streptosporangium TaxID=2632669 RepID=UPI002DDB13BB|nr:MULTISPECIES: DUF4352 domain-containing protein [unclassified Streptosporangium]WSA26773.1 DUF4352 domain-containing protein [Streptosporangium sp. NBC_01810]WSD01802.1 DUF4352 domain-containing protein [Streptosporangium sp. NBC_01755]